MVESLETKLVEQREPTPEEKDKGVEVVFIRECQYGNLHTIYARKVYGSWEQWGAFPDVLGDNVDDVEHWKQWGGKA